MVVSTYLAGKTPEQYSILAVFLLVFYFHDLEAGLGSLGSKRLDAHPFVRQPFMVHGRAKRFTVEATLLQCCKMAQLY